MNLMEITKGYEPKQNEQTDQTKNSLYTTDKWKLLAKEQAEMLEKVTVEKDELQVRNQKMNEFIQKFQERTHKLKMEKQKLFFENHEMQDEIRKLNDEIHHLTTELSETQKLNQSLQKDNDDLRKAWFNDKTATEISIAQLVEDMKAYVDTKPANFRLLFMIDEVGQYVGTDTDMLLNLQSLTEKIGSECEGKIWVICTGQEAIDEIIKVRADEFSRIQARFKTRLNLSSSSVDEVIQKRILKKKPEAAKNLEDVYEQNDSVLRNLFSFSGSILDIKGYSGPREFTENFPFVPYQFMLLETVTRKIPNGTTIWKKPSRSRKCRHSLQRFARNGCFNNSKR